ncbi:MAG TPA: PKD domain-containing protein, partial [Microthrixaceae bacterium]|nr:PKD domain-containing protein [Microthrixaceae bacterium]
PDGSIVTYDWDFGDGDSGSGLNASHTFDDGSWTVTLTVTDNLGITDTETVTVTVTNPAPVAAISANVVSGPAPLAVSFNGSASSDANGPIVTYAWNFGGGATSSAANPSHTFGLGVHTVTLTVTDEDGATDTATTTITATNQLPTAAFTRSPGSGTAPLAVSFNGSGSSDPDGTIATYSWNFGDGGTATGPNPNHTFPVGTWTVTLTVTDNVGGTDSETATVTVTNALPTASFTTTPASGNAPLNVAFNGAASSDPNGTIVSYGWNFGDGGTASGVNPSHVFGVGTFTVTLTVTDNHGGTASTTRTVTSNNVAPVASFTTTPSSGAAPLNVAFNASGSTDTSGPISTYAWDFDTAWAFAGDLVSSTSPTTSHVYTPGVYTARLTVTDIYGASSSTTRTITVSGTPAAPTGLHKIGQGCCDTYGDFQWNPVPGADAYEINMAGWFLGGCVTDHSDVTNGQTNQGRVQAVGLCLGSRYDVSIRARANGTWGPWSSTIDITL